MIHHHKAPVYGICCLESYFMHTLRNKKITDYFSSNMLVYVFHKTVTVNSKAERQKHVIRVWFLLRNQIQRYV